MIKSTSDILDQLAKNVSTSLNRLNNGHSVGNIIVPELEKHKRFSEQEARMLSIIYLWNQQQNLDIQFAIEVPTEQKYRQKGRDFSKARMDMVLYSKNETLASIEFKSGQVKYEYIRKDLEKLLVENRCGCFYHYLPHAKKQHQTGINAIVKKIYQSFIGTTDNSLYEKKTTLMSILKNRKYPIYFYLYELHSHQLFRFVFDGQCVLKSKDDIWKIRNEIKL